MTRVAPYLGALLLALAPVVDQGCDKSAPTCKPACTDPCSYCNADRVCVTDPGLCATASL